MKKHITAELSGPEQALSLSKGASNGSDCSEWLAGEHTIACYTELALSSAVRNWLSSIVKKPWPRVS